MSAELVHHGMGETTIQDWLEMAPPADGSKHELILGNIRVSPPVSTHHQFIGDKLCELFKSAARLAGCRGRYPVTSVNAVLSTARRTAVIPDIVIATTGQDRAWLVPNQLDLVAEVWSPGNSYDARWEKFEAYAQTGIRYLWTVELNGPVVEAYELHGDRYHGAGMLRAGTVGTIRAAPMPVTFDPAELLPE